MTARVNVAAIVSRTGAEGPGERFAIWVQGCPLRCPGCCNPEQLPVRDNLLLTVDELVGRIREQRRSAASIEGITLLGGEPFAQAGPLAALAGRTRALGLSVMVFSGYTLARLRTGADPAWLDLLAHTDLLVDGPYVEGRRSTSRRWIGSDNQGIHALSPRYAALVADWPQQKNTIELRLVGDRLTINGFPPALVALDG